MMDTLRMNGSTLEVTLHGKFTFGDHQEFRTILERAKDQEVQGIVFLVERLEFIDSAALGMLLLMRDLADNGKKQVAISGATGLVKKILTMAQFDKMFQLC